MILVATKTENDDLKVPEEATNKDEEEGKKGFSLLQKIILISSIVGILSLLSLSPVNHFLGRTATKYPLFIFVASIVGISSAIVAWVRKDYLKFKDEWIKRLDETEDKE